MRYLRRALDERPEPVVRAELVPTLANALVRLGDPGAGSMLGQALELAAGPVARARIVEASVDPLMAGGHAAEARRLLLGALVDADRLDPDSALLLTAQLATVRTLSGEGDDEPSGPWPTGSAAPPGFAGAALRSRRARAPGRPLRRQRRRRPRARPARTRRRSDAAGDAAAAAPCTWRASPWRSPGRPARRCAVSTGRSSSRVNADRCSGRAPGSGGAR